MKKLAAICLFAAAAAFPDIVDRIAVSVGNHVITASDLDRQIRVTSFLDGVKPDLSPAAKRSMAGKMVDQALVRRELETSRYPAPSPSEVEPVLAQFKKEHFGGDAEYQRALASYGISDQDVKDELLWERTLLAFLDVRFRPAVQVNDQDIQNYFDKTVKPAAQAAHPGEPVSLDDYRAEIEQHLTGEREDEEMARWLEQARRRTQIVYHDEAFR